MSTPLSLCPTTGRAPSWNPRFGRDPLSAARRVPAGQPEAPRFSVSGRALSPNERADSIPSAMIEVSGIGRDVDHVELASRIADAVAAMGVDATVLVWSGAHRPLVSVECSYAARARGDAISDAVKRMVEGL